MKLRKAIKAAVVVAGIAAPMMASAGFHPNVDASGWFDDWTMDTNGGIVGGNLNTLGTVGGTPTVGTGFLQRSVEVGGSTYIQTIIADVPGTIAASLDPTLAADLLSMGFTDESFIRMGSGNSNGGIASRQNFSAKDAAFTGMMAAMAPDDGYFTSRTELNTGTEFMDMMNTGLGRPMVLVDQKVWNEAAGGDGLANTADDTFSTDFLFTHGMNMMGNKWALTDINQTVDLAGEGTQTFNFDGAENVQEDGTGTITSILGAAGSSEFNIGDNIEKVAVGQTIAGLGEFGYGRFGQMGASVNGYNFLDMTTPAVVYTETAADAAGTPDGSNDPFDGLAFVN